MNTRSLTAGTIVGAVVLFAVGFVLYSLLLEGVYAANMDSSLSRAAMDWPSLGLSMLVWAFFLTYVFSKWAGVRSVGAGASAGAILGLLVTLAFDLGMYSMTTVMQPIMLIIDPIAAAVWYGSGGAAVGFALSRFASE